MLVFAYDDPGVVHLAERARLGEKTLCGLEAMPKVLTRREVTCPDCLLLKPTVLGGEASR